MDNADFRGLLSSLKSDTKPKGGGGGGGGGGGDGGGDGSLRLVETCKSLLPSTYINLHTTPSKTKLNAIERAKKYKALAAKQKDKEDKADVSLTSKYRDRASERRLGISEEYTDITAEEAMTISIENSKYLGGEFHMKPCFSLSLSLSLLVLTNSRRKSLVRAGDEEHTHLVKGLDPILLAKMRRQLDDSRVSSKEEGGRGDSNIHFQTNLARLVYTQLFKNDAGSTISRKLESFLPGRTTYVFQTNEYKDNSLYETT
jgi:IK cytokine